MSALAAALFPYLVKLALVAIAALVAWSLRTWANAIATRAAAEHRNTAWANILRVASIVVEKWEQAERPKFPGKLDAQAAATFAAGAVADLLDLARAEFEQLTDSPATAKGVARAAVESAVRDLPPSIAKKLPPVAEGAAP